ncbi:MAG: hypothetical protein MUE81_20190 [Thermoflexibacter sp.]|nr:hypothetical protein [Thermoflexibacter sp.]
MGKQAPSKNIVVQYTKYDQGQGNTSLAYDGKDIYKWSAKTAYPTESWGYFDRQGNEICYIKRDRDLGQTFKYTEVKKKRLVAITVQLGFGTNVVRRGMYGQPISIQLLEVSGTPKLNNNGSDSTLEAFHGFPHDRNGKDIASVRDDYWEGETYKTIAVFSGGYFPPKSAFGFSESDTIPPNHIHLKGNYLTFKFPNKHKIMLETGKTYAFLIMIDNMGEEAGFALANEYYGSYPHGHGIRRDGNGTFPPAPADPHKDFADPANAQAYRTAHFPKDFKQRIAIAPSTNGYPDVDTWRDFVFYIVAE